jgi:hypothetical protein
MNRRAIILAFLALASGFSSPEAFAAAGPARFLCSKLEIGCRKPSRPAKARRPTHKPAAATRKKKAKPIVKAAPVKPAPVEPAPVKHAPVKHAPVKHAPEKPGPSTVAGKPAPVLPRPKPEELAPEQRGEQIKTPPAEPPKKVVEPPPSEPKHEESPAQPMARESAPPSAGDAACRADLTRLGVDFSDGQDRITGSSCSVVDPVGLKSVKSVLGLVSLPGNPVLACPFAKQFAIWVADIAAPVVAAHRGAKLDALSTGPGFQCRGRVGEAAGKMSEHASGNAIDIDALVAGGKRIEIAEVAAPDGPARRLLMALRLSACGYFTTVLGPGSNAAHASHYHFDLGVHGKSANYRICE